MKRNESIKVIRHCRDISRNQNAAGARCDLQDVWIRSAVWEHARCSAKIDRRFPPLQCSPDFRVKVGVGLKTEVQACFTDFSFFARSKRSIISGGRG